MIRVQLNVVSNSFHISQIITGFILLEKQGLVKLTVNKVQNSSKYPHVHIVEAIVEDSVIIVYDLLDGYNCNVVKLERYLDKVDYYFKRSFCKKRNLNIIGGDKIYPLGFNYHVTIKGNPIDKYSDINSKIKEFLRKLLKKDRSRFIIDVLEQVPTYKMNDTPKVIFCTRLYSPSGEKGEGLIDEKLKLEREYINDMRVSIIKGLKAKLGENFIGGLSDTEYTRSKYPELLLSKSITNRNNYLKQLRKVDICIGSMGLHQSIGWKTAEYIAFSKAIINEKLNYDVTGNFKESENYLSFSTAKECINHVEYLINNPQEIIRMQQNNYNYYMTYLRPDRLILNTLNKVSIFTDYYN